jgi:hypothetical protein
VFIFGATLLVLLIGILVLALIGQGVQAILTAVGAVVDGAGVAFLVNQRNQAISAEELAYADVKTQCGSTAPVDAVRNRLKVYGVR